MDVLSDVLSTVRLESTVYAQTSLSPPWGISADAQGVFAFHVIPRGHGWLEAEGLAPYPVGAGDVVLLAPGRAHSLRDEPSSPTRPLRDLLAEGAFNAGADGQAGGPATTQLVCGCFSFEEAAGAGPLLAALPTVMRAGEMGQDAGPWLAQTIRLLGYESLAARPGTQTVVNRLCDVLFVYLLRIHLAELPAEQPSWLRALVDPQIGAALQLLHEQPGKAWTVGTLAGKVGMSRSAFAARFHQVVGQAPMQYLKRWRLQKAAAVLAAGSSGIARVAAEVGYESEAAFAKAFKRTLGVSPGAYRRSRPGAQRG